MKSAHCISYFYFVEQEYRVSCAEIFKQTQNFGPKNLYSTLNHYFKLHICKSVFTQVSKCASHFRVSSS